MGINCNAPSYALDVKGSANVSNAYYVNGALQSTTYTLANTVTVAQYIFIGTWTTAQEGRKLLITLTSSQGYNSSPTQQQVTRLCMNTGNGSSVINGTSGGLVYFSAAAYIDTPLGGATGSPSTFRIVQVSSAYGSTVLAVYGNFSAFIGSAFYTVSVSGGDSWTNSSTLYGVTGPTGTYLDVTPSVSPTISGSNYGFGTTAPAYTLDVNGSINSTGSIYVRGTNYLITYGGTSGYTYMNTDSNGYGYMRAAGSYLFMGAGGTSTLAVTNNAMSINTGAGPNYTLDVGGTTRLTTASSLASTAPDGGANHGLMLVSTKAPDSGKTAYSMALGVDSGTGYGYINAAGNTALQPILLQSRGGGVGIGLTTAPGYTLDVGGQIRIYETTGTNVVAGTANTMPTTAIAGKTSGSLTLYHNNANGHSSILFPSKTNDGGDYGYITFMDDVSNRAGSEESRLLIGCDNDYGTDHVILQPFGGRVGVGNMLPEYKLHVAGNARLANFVFNDDRLSLNYSDTDTGFDWISDGVFRIINNESETLRISSWGIDMYNHDISGVKDINNTNLYATSAIVSGTTAGRLVMIGVQSGCYIEAGLDSTTGSAVPLYFTDMSNSNQWMCIGSTGNVGINNNSPVGRFHVKTSGNALDTFLGWDSTWMVVTPAANAATAKNTPGLGLGYSVASNTAYVTALAPNDSWKDLRLDASNIQLVPHSPGIVNVSGGFKVVHGTRTFSTSNGNFNFGVYGAYDTEPYGAIQIAQPSNNLDYTSNGQWGYSIIQAGSRVSGIGMLPNNAGKIVIGSGATPTDGSSNGITVDVTNKRLGIACNAPAYSLDVSGPLRGDNFITVQSNIVNCVGGTRYVALPLTVLSAMYAYHIIGSVNGAGGLIWVYRQSTTSTYTFSLGQTFGGSTAFELGTNSATTGYTINVYANSANTNLQWSLTRLSYTSVF